MKRGETRACLKESASKRDRTAISQDSAWTRVAAGNLRAHRNHARACQLLPETFGVSE